MAVSRVRIGALARMLGLTREALVGQPVEEILAQRRLGNDRAGNARRRGPGDAAIHEVMLRAKTAARLVPTDVAPAGRPTPRTFWC